MNGNFLSALPKPVRFGLFGAVGGLLGALLIGELLWWMLEPPPPPAPTPPPPSLAVSVSPTVGVYQGGKNKFSLGFKSERLGDAPISVAFTGQPSGVTIESSGTDRESREAEVTVSNLAPPGVHKVTTTATATANGEVVKATAEVEIRVDPLPKPMVDVVFVLDITSSMQKAIDGIRDGIKSFAEGLDPKRIDFRIGLIAYRDELIGERPEVLTFGRENKELFTTDPEEFKRKVSGLIANGGGDIPESTLDALCQAAEFPFRPKCTKVLLVVTDAPPQIPDKRISSMKEAVRVLKLQRIDQVHLVVPPDEKFVNDGKLRKLYEQLWDGPTGQFFDFQKIATGRDSFNRILPELSKVIATAAAASRATDVQLSAAPPTPDLPATQGLQSSRAYDASAQGRLLLAISFWTAAIAAGISLALAAMQYLSLNRVPPPTAILLGLAGGAIAGLIGGAAGQGLFALASGSSIIGVLFRVIGWSVLGALAGAGLAFVVPNLRKAHGLVGGLLGGAFGAIGYLLVSGVGLGDTAGRLAGAVILGFFIGLMVALVEAAMRRAWLEVRFSGGETITVNLGPEPVKVGGDGRLCAVWARGADPVALRYWLREGQVVCDVTGEGERTASNGDRRKAGGVEVIVRTANTAAPARKAPARPLSLDDDDDMPPSRPAPPPPPRSKAVAPPVARPVVPSPPRSVAPSAARPSASPPPSKAVPPPAARSAFKCPECGAGMDKAHGVCPSCGAMN